MHSIPILCIHMQSIQNIPPYHSEYILIFLHTLSVWQPQPYEFTSYSLNMAASNSWVYIIFTQYGSLKLLSLHHIRSMWQPQPREFISKINQNLSFPKKKFSQIHENYSWKILESHMGELFRLKRKINNEFLTNIPVNSVNLFQKYILYSTISSML